MDSLTTYLGDYWWVVALPLLLMLLIWFFRGRGLRWILFVCVAAFMFFFFSDGSSSGVGYALTQVVNHVVDVLRQVGASFL